MLQTAIADALTAAVGDAAELTVGQDLEAPKGPAVLAVLPLQSVDADTGSSVEQAFV